MERFYAQDGQFWFNDQPQLIQAGELHYFRTPPDQWRHRLGLLQKAGFNTLATYIPWLWHQPEENLSDFDGHSHPMRNLAGFLDLAAEMGFFIIARPGPYIMAETINEGIPPWVFDKYPQAAFINQRQKAENIASYLHPDFLACIRQWYRGVFGILSARQVTRSGRIIMIQLDNEMGMIPWVRNIVDTNPDTLERFSAYLQTHTAETGFSPSKILEELTSPSQPALLEHYRRFYRGYLREYTTFLWDEARANGMDVLPVINIHGFGNGGKTFPIGLSQLADVINLENMLSATDVYPIHIDEGNFHQMLLVNEATKALQNPAQALFSIEFQAGGNTDFGGGQTSLYDLHSRLCISGGMRAINHYLFFDGENHPVLSPVKRHDWGHPVRKDGSTRKHYDRYPRLSRTLAAYGPDLVLARPQTVTTLGFLLDYFMTEVNNPLTQDATNSLTHQRDVLIFDFLARGLALTHRPFDAVEVTRATLDVVTTPLLWLMLERQCDAATQQKLVDYVLAGGKLALAGRMCLEDFEHRACTILKDALGIREIAGGLPFAPALLTAFQYHDVPASFVETYSGEFEQVFATRQDGGETVGFVKKLGRGTVLMLGAALAANTLDDLDIFHQMALEMGCQPQFRMSAWADVRLSRGGQGSFVFINNYQDDPLETVLESGGEAWFNGNPLRLRARSGLILPVNWQAVAGVFIHFLTSEVVEICQDEAGVEIFVDPPGFCAELSLRGYAASASEGAGRVLLSGTDGRILLRRCG